MKASEKTDDANDSGRNLGLQRDQLRRLGYASYPALVAPDELAALRRAAEEALSRAPAVDRVGAPGARVDVAEYTFRRYADRVVVYRVNRLWRHNPVFKAALAQPALLRVTWALLGEPFLPCNQQLAVKAAHAAATAWHRDPTGRPGEGPRREHHDVVVGLYLDNADHDTGCLCVIPASHRWEASSGEDILGSSRPDVPGAIEVAAAAGDVVVHETALIHGSLRNPSARTRGTIYTHYVPVRAMFESGKTDPYVRGVARFFAEAVRERRGDLPDACARWMRAPADAERFMEWILTS